ncbi:MAG: AraC family transcriptional regulator [Sphingobium sp.]
MKDMTNPLLDAVRRYADAHVDASGLAVTPVTGLSTIRALGPSELQYAINRPLVAIVVQGGKRVTMGRNTYDFGAGESLLIAADVPTVSQITRASIAAPYYSFVFELDPAVIEALTVEMQAIEESHGVPVRVDPTEREVADAAFRLIQILDRPSALPLLKDQLIRELHYWLLAGSHGAAIRAMGVTNSRAQRIGRAVTRIREDYSQPLRVDELAEAAGMSPSSFHQHFRIITSLSPLQFQKQLRLIEARRMMLAEGTPASNAAYAVGYESIPQFTREYGRMFGAPPVRDINAARTRPTIAA